MVTEIPERKLKANIARNTTFDGRQENICTHFWVKNGRN